MKHIQKLLGVITLTFLFVFQASASNISLYVIDVFDTHTMSISLSDTSNLSQWEVQGDVKILRDTTITNAQKNTDDAKVVTVKLDEGLEIHSSYSLLTLFWAEGSIDFQTGDVLSNTVIKNQNPEISEQTIDQILIIDAHTVEVTYTTDVAEWELEYNILTETPVSSIEKLSDNNNRITLRLWQALRDNSEYILMIVSLTGKDGNQIVFENSISDFTTPETIQRASVATGKEYEKEIQEVEDTQSIIAAKIAARNAQNADTTLTQEDDMIMPEQEQGIIPDVEPLTEEYIENMDFIEDDMYTETPGIPTVDEMNMMDHPEIQDELSQEEVELNSAGLMKTTIAVASSAQSVPKTGAETWILIFASLFINGFYYFSRRKRA